jgi:LmbE family N-acetylglucosaminyl deacetylase
LDGVGADDDSPCAVTEGRLADKGVGVGILWATEGDNGELDAGHQDACATVVLGQVFGQTQ